MTGRTPSVRLDHHGDGTPFAVVDFGYNRVTGRRERYQRNFRGLSDDAALEAGREWAGELVAERSGGVSMALGDQLAVLTGYREAEGRSANTVAKDRSTIRNYLGPLARMRADEVTTRDVNDLLRELQRKGGRSGRALSPSTVRDVRNYLNHAFGMLSDMGVVESNPVRDAIRVRPDQARGESLDEADVAALLGWLGRALAEEPDGRAGRLRRNAAMGMMLALSTGMRCGEVCALRRRDVRLVSRTVTVDATVVEVSGGARRQAGTKGHRLRNIQMGADLAELVRGHLAWLDREVWGLTGDSPLLTADGGWMRPGYMGAEFRRMRRECGIDDRFTFHSLRHTHATWLLRAGVDLRTVSERLGHADPATTARIYAHALPGSDGRAAERGMADLRATAEAYGAETGGLWADGRDGRDPSGAGESQGEGRVEGVADSWPRR